MEIKVGANVLLPFFHFNVFLMKLLKGSFYFWKKPVKLYGLGKGIFCDFAKSKKLSFKGSQGPI